VKDLTFVSLLPLLAFLLFLLLQTWLPRRDIRGDAVVRAAHNLLLFLINTVIFRFAIPLGLVLVSLWASDNVIGFFNLIHVSHWLAVMLCVVALDFAVYWQHVATHKIDLLWRLHKVHHADHQMDVTTAVRFHPVELLLSLLYKSLAVLLLGAPVAAVLLFELILFIGPAFNHSNMALPRWLDSALRTVIATPDVHRAHHSVYKEEQDTNYGFFLIWWDRLFNTYTKAPRDGHVDMRIGLSDSTKEETITIDKMLLMPFKK